MANRNTFDKDPDADLDFQINWAAWLATSETISDSEWIADEGITTHDDSYTNTTSTVWLSGGDVSHSYIVTCRITTNQGRVDDRSLTINVRGR